MFLRSLVVTLVMTVAIAGTTAAIRAAARGQSSDTTILLQGRVINDDRMPLNRAYVEMLSDDSSDPAATYSNREGQFSISMRSLASSRVKVSKPGFVAQVLQLREIASRMPRAGGAMQVTVTLAKGAVVIGSVVDDLGDPVAGARVIVKHVGSAPPTSATEERTVDTDDRGEFRIGSLGGGEVEVTSTEVPVHGQRLDAATGQWLSDAEVTLITTPVRALLRAGAETFVSLQTRVRFASPTPQSSRSAPAVGTGVIAGRISRADGRPLGRALVQLTRSNGESVALTQSDAQGRYELSGVSGGGYRMSVNKQGFPTLEYGQTRAGQSGAIITVREGQRLQNIDITLGRGSVITGRVVDAEGEPVEGVVMEVFQVVQCGDSVAVSGSVEVENMVRTTDDRGEYRLYGLVPSTYFVTARRRTRAFMQGATDADSVPVYYPGTSSAAGALRVAVRANDQLRVGDTIFDPLPGARISGHALDSTGQPVSGSAVLVTSQRSGAPHDQPRIAGISKGDFEFSKVPPGEYTVQIVNGPLFAGGGEFGAQIINVTGTERLPLLMTTSAGSRLSGRIVFEGDANSLRPADFSLGVSSTDNDQSPIIGESQPQTTINDDWTFAFERVTGVFRIISSRTPEAWWLKSVLIDGINAAEQGVVFGTREASRTDVEVVFSRTAASVSGRTLDAKKMPVSNGSVAVFTTDSTRWRTLARRYSRLVRSDQDGRFRAAGLPPGEYFVTAFDDADIGPGCSGTVTPDLLTMLARSAHRLRLGPGERLAQDLQVP